MDFNSWWSWVLSFEPSLNGVSISPTTPGIISEAYQSALDLVSGADDSTMTVGVRGLTPYLSNNNLQRLVYNYALHLLIVRSGRSNLAPLKALYDGYGVGGYSGILTSGSDGGTSASKLIPNILQNGDANTLNLWSTSYGQVVEETFEQLRNIAITN